MENYTAFGIVGKKKLAAEEAAEQFIASDEAFKEDLIKKIGVNENEFYKQLRDFTIELTKKRIRESKNFDVIMKHTVDLLGEVQKNSNKLYERLSELYGAFNPEKMKTVRNMEELVKLTSKLSNSNSNMGWKLEKSELEIITRLSDELRESMSFSSYLEKKIEGIMRKNVPNISEVAGALLGARLISYAGSLRRLAFFPSSTIQLLGAEKALFMHLQKGTKPPKHGMLLHHPKVAKAEKKGKAARKLANKISIAAKIDYFRREDETSKA